MGGKVHILKEALKDPEGFSHQTFLQEADATLMHKELFKFQINISLKM